MSRRLLVAALAMAMLASATPALAGQYEWSLPNPKQWVGKLIDSVGEKLHLGNGGGAESEEVEEGEPIEDPEPGGDPEFGPFIEPSG